MPIVFKISDNILKVNYFGLIIKIKLSLTEIKESFFSLKIKLFLKIFVIIDEK